MKKITIAYFAIGSALKFDRKKLLRSDGSTEYYNTIHLLVRNANVEKIVLLSKSDWMRISQAERDAFDPKGKIYDPFTDMPELKKRKQLKDQPPEIQREYYVNFFEEFTKKNIHIDFGIGFISQGWTTASLGGYFNNLKPPHAKVKSLTMAVYYAAEIIYYLNMTGLKWWLLSTDPRYIKPSMRHRDICNLPQTILGQQDFDIKWYHVKNMDHPDTASVENGDYFIEVKKSEYSGIEKMNLMNSGILDIDTQEKPHQFTIVSLQVTAPSEVKDSRFDILKEYILDRDVDKTARIFGKWSDYFKNGYPQFKGYIATEDLDRTFAETRYTLVLPTDAGWVTSKYAEMLQLGVVPFLHPNYDKQYHIVPKDHPIRIKNADDFYAKMEYYDAHPDERIALVKKLQKDLISDAYSGKFMIDLFNKHLKRADMSDCLFDDSDVSLFPPTTKVISPKKEIVEDITLDSFFS